METVGERIKQVWKKLSLSQQKFAEEIGASRPHISSLENGNDQPSANLIRLISLQFHINEQWILTGDGSMMDDFIPYKDKTEAELNSEFFKTLFEHQRDKAVVGEEYERFTQELRTLTKLLPSQSQAYKAHERMFSALLEIVDMETKRFYEAGHKDGVTAVVAGMETKRQTK